MIIENSNRKFLARLDSVQELLSLPASGRDSLAREFNGNCTLEQAKELLLKGWPEGKRKLGTITHASGFSEKESNHVFDLVESVTGSMVDMGKYLTGEPECMLEFTSGRSDKLVSILYNVVPHSGISANAMFFVGAYLMQAIDALEANGYRTEITYRNAVCNGRFRSEIFIKLKEFGHSLDEDFLTFCFCHPAFLRQVILDYLRANGLDSNKKLSRNLGYPDLGDGFPDYDIVIEKIWLANEHSTKGSIEKCFEKYNLHLDRHAEVS